MTEDGVTIVGTHLTGPSGGPSALLLHMMPATKESWDAFAEALITRGFTQVLAIDERGHGESTQGPGEERLDYTQFEDDDQKAKMLDIKAAVAWMQERGCDKRTLAVAGASIGANLSIVYASENKEVPVAIALSPGLDYRSVTTPDAVEAMDPSQHLYLAASEEDELSFMTDKALVRLKPDAVLREFKDAGHGTTMFDTVPGFMDELADWTAEHARRND